MKRNLALTAFFAAVLGVLAGVALVPAQSVFPMRFDEEPTPQAVIPTNLGTISADAIRLVPRTSEPFVCDSTTEGYLWAYDDFAADISAYGGLLCQCKRDEDAATYSWQHAGKIGGTCPT